LDRDHHGAAGAKRSRITAVPSVVAHLPPEQAPGLAAAKRPAKRRAGASAIATAAAPQDEAPESQSSGSHGARKVMDSGVLGNVAALTARGPVTAVTRMGGLPTAFKV
jgi:hypothetical protein